MRTNILIALVVALILFGGGYYVGQRSRGKEVSTAQSQYAELKRKHTETLTVVYADAMKKDTLFAQKNDSTKKAILLDFAGRLTRQQDSLLTK